MRLLQECWADNDNCDDENDGGYYKATIMINDGGQLTADSWRVLILNDIDKWDHDDHDEKMTMAMKIMMMQWKIQASITQYDNNDNDYDEMKIDRSLLLWQ